MKAVSEAHAAKDKEIAEHKAALTKKESEHKKTVADIHTAKANEIAEHKAADPDVRDRGISLFTATVRRPAPDTLDQKLNCHSKLHEVIALIQATSAGADEALMLDPTGAVATCNATNFFIFDRDGLHTATGQYNLNGITSELVCEVAEAAGIPVHRHAFSLTDVYAADEAFVTGTFGGLTPVHTIDGRTIGTGEQGPMTIRLRELYEAAIEADVAGR